MKKQLFALALGLAYTLSATAFNVDTTLTPQEDSILMKSVKLEAMYKRFMKAGTHDFIISSTEKQLCIHDRLAGQEICLDKETMTQLLVMAYKQNQDKIAGLVEKFGKNIKFDNSSFSFKLEPTNKPGQPNFNAKFTAPSACDKHKPVVFSLSGQRTENNDDLIAYKVTNKITDPESEVKVTIGITESGIMSQAHGSLKNFKAATMEKERQAWIAEHNKRMAAYEEELKRLMKDSEVTTSEPAETK